MSVFCRATAPAVPEARAQGPAGNETAGRTP